MGEIGTIMTYPVFIQENAQLEKYSISDSITVSDSEAHHAIAVMRLKKGDIVDIVDGKGIRIRACIKDSDKTKFESEVIEKIVEQPKKIRLHLVQALAKGGRDEQAVESCVELGICSVIPWKADRCISVWVGNKIQKSISKWESLVFAATKQSRQAFLPKVLPMMDNKALLKLIEENSTPETGFFILHESAENYLTDLPQEMFDNYNQIYMVVGPEGGITDKELDFFESKGGVKVRLSDSVLRTSNAGAVALTMIATRAKLWSDK